MQSLWEKCNQSLLALDIKRTLDFWALCYTPRCYFLSERIECMSFKWIWMRFNVILKFFLVSKMFWSKKIIFLIICICGCRFTKKLSHCEAALSAFPTRIINWYFKYFIQNMNASLRAVIVSSEFLLFLNNLFWMILELFGGPPNKSTHVMNYTLRGIYYQIVNLTSV